MCPIHRPAVGNLPEVAADPTASLIGCRAEIMTAELDAAGPARRSSLVRQAWRTGPPPVHSPRAAAEPDWMTRPSRRILSWELLADSGPGPGPDVSPSV